MTRRGAGQNLDNFYVARPGADEIQLDLFGDYKSNVALYPSFQKYFRTYKPPLLAVWGKKSTARLRRIGWAIRAMRSPYTCITGLPRSIRFPTERRDRVPYRVTSSCGRFTYPTLGVHWHPASEPSVGVLRRGVASPRSRSNRRATWPASTCACSRSCPGM
jgi:hypothetical protein